MGKIVKHLKVHQDLFIAGLGALGNTLPSASKTLPDLVMSLESEGVLVKAKNIEAVVPYANIVVLTLGESYHDKPKSK